MDNKKYYELTIPQQNIWLVEQLNPNTTINNIYGTLSIKKSLDLNILKNAINKIIENNDALRIRIDEIDSKPMQYIHEFEYEDLPVYFIDANEKEKIQNIIRTISLEHINILNNKLYDFRIIYSPTEVTLCVKMHHLIADAWSMAQLFVEHLNYFYEKLENHLIAEPKPSYISYIEKNNNYINSEKFTKDKLFWENYVSDLNCENQYHIPKQKKCNRKTKSLGNDLYDKINKYCKTNNITEYTFFLGIISTYFAKLFSNRHLVIGTPFLNRKKSDKEFDMMGMFVTTLPLHIHVSKDLNFIELCKQINSTNLSCFKHSNYPYSEIQKAYSQSSGNVTNLYEIAFSYQINNLENNFDCNIYKNTWFANEYQSNPLFISYMNHFGEHELCYDYWINSFDELDIDNLHDRITYIINQVVKKNDIKISEITIISKNDINQLKQFNCTGDLKYTEETIVSKFEKIVKEKKSEIALIYGDTQISYTELNQKSNSVANSLIELGAKKGSPISIIFDKCPEMFITMLGIMKAGCYYIPILPEEEQERAEFIILNSESQFLITSNRYSSQISSKIISQQLVIDDLLKNKKNNPNISIKPDNICYLIYTSGSTGTPKGVTLTHKNIISFLQSIQLHEDIQFKENDISLSLLKYSFDGSACDIYSSLLNGGKLVIIPKQIELNPELVVKLIEKEKITRFIAVPTWINRLQSISKNKKIDLSSVRFIGMGGEALKPQKLNYLFSTYPNLKMYNVYGPTETTIFTTVHQITENDIENNYSPIGKPIPGSRAIILGDNNQVLPINTKGELVIYQDDTSIKNLTNGYFKLEEKTQQNYITFINPITNKTVKGYKTGDLAKINNNFEIDFFGRNDDFKKVNGGYLVSLTEIETKIQKTLGNAFDIAVVSTNIRNINSIVLFVAKKSSSFNITVSDIKNEIDRKLTFYMKPKKIIEIDKIPITNNGKFNKRLLEKQAQEYVENHNTIILPTNKFEQKIYNTIKEIINCDFSITDDFEDDLGIDSLNMTILYSKLSNHKISLQDLYNYPTVKDLAHLIYKECSLEHDISSDDIKIYNASNKMNLEKILITGTTGFVGTHLLKEFAENENTKKIYCIVRQKINLNSEERFEKIINNYFDEETCKKIRKKAIVLNGDLRKENLGLDDITFKKVFNEVKTIINAAANVKHIGKYHTSYVDNVETVNNLIKICTEFHISLAHISTLSLNGYYNDNVTEKFTENKLNINQTFNKNPYLITKYEAEQLILKNISENYLNAKIFRIGNIMPRLSDGIFQTNFEDNGFLIAIKKLSELKIFTNSMLNQKIYLTPVDECCNCINKILNSDYCNTIYHIENDKNIKISSILECFNERNIQFTEVSEEIFYKKLSDDYSFGTEYIKSIFSNNHNKYSKESTLDILNKLNYTWKSIPKTYLENIINISMKIRR